MRLELKPAPAEHGIRFRRTDVGVEIPATLEHLARLDHATTLSRDGVSVDTVEHLLSALYALGVDDVAGGGGRPRDPDHGRQRGALRDPDPRGGPAAADRAPRQLPEGPAAGRGRARRQVGAALARPTTSGSATPSASTIRCCATRRASVRVTADTFAETIAPARTFGFLREVETLRKNGLALGGSLENAVVIGETGVLNNKLRFEDEFVRHKILDAIGDLALLGHPLVGHLEAVQGRPRAARRAGPQAAGHARRPGRSSTHPQLPVVDLPPPPAPPRLALEPS